MSPKALLDFVFKGKVLISKDVDRYVDNEFIDPISNFFEIEIHRIRMSMVSEFAKNLIPETKNIFKTPNWILSPSLQLAKKHYGIRYCKRCLAETEYLKLEWRMKFVTCCSIHDCRLSHRCQKCGSSINPLKLTQNGSLKNCWCCQGSLISGPAIVVPISYVVRQKYLLQVMHHGGGDLGGMVYPTKEIFTMLDRFCTLATLSRFSKDIRRHMLLHYRLLLPDPKASVADHLYLVPEVLDTALILLSDWPFNFIKAARDTRMSLRDVTKILAGTSFAFEHFPIPP